MTLGHLQLVRSGAHAVGEWRRENPQETLDLSRALLLRQDLAGVDLSGADLRGANLTKANLGSVNLSGARLAGATFTAAQFHGTQMHDTDLSEALGLDQVDHLGPSSLGVPTLVRSQGRISADFLRRCGFSPWMAVASRLYDPALAGEDVVRLQDDLIWERTRGPYVVGGVFVAFAGDDCDVAQQLQDAVNARGIPSWRVNHDHVGMLEPLRSLRTHDVVCLVLSEASVASDWVENELDMARQREKSENREVLCPVAIDGSWQKKVGVTDTSDRQLWRTLKHKNILDFSAWRSQEVFREQFEKLLKGMAIYYTPKH